MNKLGTVIALFLVALLCTSIYYSYKTNQEVKNLKVQVATLSNQLSRVDDKVEVTQQLIFQVEGAVHDVADDVVYNLRHRR